MASLTGMDDDCTGLGRGSRVWYRADDSTWLLAELRDPPAPTSDEAAAAAARRKGLPLPQVAGITLLSGPSAGRPLDGVPAGAVMPANPEVQATIPDLTQLSYLNEPSILGNLALRYGADKIYTCAGPVLIALNPCKELPLYTDEVQHDYKSERRRRSMGRHDAAGAAVSTLPAAAQPGGPRRSNSGSWRGQQQQRRQQQWW